MGENPPPRSRIAFNFGALAVIVFVGSLAWFTYMRCFQRDTLWRWQVRRQIDPSALRAWAFQVLSNTQPDRRADGMLTNAPAYLVNSYRYRPLVTQDPDSVRLTYGGGF